jgi:hypothetical protein
VAEDMQTESSEAPVTCGDGTQSEERPAAPTYRAFAVEFAAGAD